jgi:NarL family two-component system response regulator LiaR
MEKPIRVLIADDHAMLRQGTVVLLERETDIIVAGEARDGLEAVQMAHSLRPDIVIMDVRMPVLSGLEATRQIQESLPDVRVLVLTAHDDDQYVFSLLEAGASGYLLKTAPINDLVKAIRQVMAGESPLDPAIARKVVVRATRLGEPGGREGDSGNGDILTPRELEILRLLVQGLSNRRISDTLFISDRTVQAHLTNIFAKMQVSSRLEAVLKGIRRGWLTVES